MNRSTMQFAALLFARDTEKAKRRCLVRRSLAMLVLLTLMTAAGCTPTKTITRPAPTGKEVGKERKSRAEDTLRDFERRRDFAEYQAALIRWKQQELDGCQDLLVRLLARNPKHVEGRRLLGELYLYRQDPEKALPLFESLAKEFPSNAQVQHGYAEALEANHKTQEAIAHYARAVDLEPENEFFLASFESAREMAAELPDAKFPDVNLPDPKVTDPKLAGRKRAADASIPAARTRDSGIDAVDRVSVESPSRTAASTAAGCSTSSGCPNPSPLRTTKPLRGGLTPGVLR